MYGIITAPNPRWFYFCDSVLYLWDPLECSRKQSTHLSCASVQVYGTEETTERPMCVCVCMHSGALGCGILKHYFVSLTCIPLSPHIFFCLSSRSQRLALCTAYHIWTWRERGRVDGLSLLCCQKQWKVVYSRWEYIVSWVEGVHVYRLHGGGCFCSSRPWRRALLKREGHSNMLSIGLMLTDCVLSCVCGQDVHVAEKVTHPPLVYLQIIIGRGWGDDPVFLLLQCLQSVLLSHSHSCTASFKTHQ